MLHSSSNRMHLFIKENVVWPYLKMATTYEEYELLTDEHNVKYFTKIIDIKLKIILSK